MEVWLRKNDGVISGNSSFPMVTISSPKISRPLLLMMSKTDKLPLETEPIAYDNNTSLVTKLSSLLGQLIILVKQKSISVSKCQTEIIVTDLYQVIIAF